MTIDTPIARRRPGRGRLAATSCVTRGVQGEAAQQAWFLDVRWLVVASALSWGLGYLLLGHRGRAAAALAAGAVGNVLAANAALGAWSGAPDGGGEASLRQTSLIWAGVIVAAVLLELADTWRLGRGDRPAGHSPDRRRHEPESVAGGQ